MPDPDNINQSTADAATEQIIADMDYLAQLMLAGSMPPLPSRPCDVSETLP